MPRSIFRSGVWASVLCALVFSACGSDGDDACPESVDSKMWLAAAEGADVRREIAETAARCDLLDSKSKAEVERLLGPAPRPEEITPEEGRFQWYYFLGEVNDSDEQHLIVKFSPDGRVEQALISP